MTITRLEIAGSKKRTRKITAPGRAAALEMIQADIDKQVKAFRRAAGFGAEHVQQDGNTIILTCKPVITLLTNLTVTYTITD